MARRRHPARLIFPVTLGLSLGCTACTSLPPPSPGAADVNRVALYTLPLNGFGRPETGWAIYAPTIEQTLNTHAVADTPAFASALAHWQARHNLAADGVMSAETFAAMKAGWQTQRPFVRVRAKGACPAPPTHLADAKADEGYGGKIVQLRPGALRAYRRLIAEARKAEPDIAAHPTLLTLFSGYRSPEYDTERCAQERNCQGVVRAACSAHRTGLALDLVLDAAPGFSVDSSADANRLAMINGLAFRWLVANAYRHGFVNYAFEPWHWEWTGEAP